jgi:hypothetical protein
MAELKTKETAASVDAFIKSIKDEQKKEDSLALLKMLEQATKMKPKMWGSSIVGFGNYHYKGKSGREGDWFPIGFSPRKQNMTVYFCFGFEAMKEQLKKLGKFKTSMGCLYFNKLDDIDTTVLKSMMKTYLASIKKKV